MSLCPCSGAWGRWTGHGEPTKKLSGVEIPTQRGGECTFQALPKMFPMNKEEHSRYISSDKLGNSSVSSLSWLFFKSYFVNFVSHAKLTFVLRANQPLPVAPGDLPSPASLLGTVPIGAKSISKSASKNKSVSKYWLSTGIKKFKAFSPYTVLIRSSCGSLRFNSHKTKWPIKFNLP